MPPPPDSSTLPCSPVEAVDGVLYLPRLAAKIRLNAQGRLWEDLHANLGKGMDKWCSEFLHVKYDDLVKRVLKGDSDEKLLQWCQQNGRELNATDKAVWKSFILKLGLDDPATAMLESRKTESGLADRADIKTMAHYIDVDEGRKP